eukprot:COSAG06_NODE_388_length_16429_cov_129.962094_3_plen_183_part_00
MKACRAVHATPVRDASLATVLVEEVATVRRPKKPTDALAPRQLLCPALWRGEPCSTSARRRHTAPCSLLINGPSRPSSRAAAVGFRIGSCTGSATCGRPRGKKTPNARAAKWGHSPKSWGNGGNIPLFPGLGECVRRAQEARLQSLAMQLAESDCTLRVTNTHLCSADSARAKDASSRTVIC